MQRLKSILFTPANNARRLAKAANSLADGVCIDLEDSVPASDKQAARESITAAAKRLKAADKTVLVRVNNEAQIIDLDLKYIDHHCDILVLPKTQGPAQLQTIGDKLAQLARDGRCDLQCIALLEDAAALQKLRLFPDFHHARISGLTLGTEDLSHALNCQPDAALLVHCFHELALIARSMGVQLLGFPATIGEYKNLPLYQQQIKAGRAAGASGAFAIHPNQLGVLNQVFSITAAEQQWAQAVITAFELARTAGEAVAALNGRMIDKPVYLRALALMDNALVDNALVDNALMDNALVDNALVDNNRDC